MRNMKESINTKKDNAVSPVIGVMLMLVVTIVIAAFVATFASGMFSTSEHAPAASIDTKIIYNGGYDGRQCVMLIENKGGDSIPTSDLRIVTYYTSASGSKRGTIKTESASATLAAIRVTNSTGNTNQYCVVPVLADASKGDVYGSKVAESNKAINFGNYNFAPGTIMTTYNDLGTGKILFADTSLSNAQKDLNKAAGTTTDFGIGSNVHVEIVHIPTSTVLYSKDVIVA